MIETREDIINYLFTIFLEDREEAEINLNKVYAGLLNDGFLPEELSDVESILEIFERDYLVRTEGDVLIEALAKKLVEMAIADSIEEESDELPEFKYLVMQHRVSLEDDGVSLGMVKYIFDSISDINELVEGAYKETMPSAHIIKAVSIEELDAELIGYERVATKIKENIHADAVAVSVAIYSIDFIGIKIPTSLDIYSIHEITEY